VLAIQLVYPINALAGFIHYIGYADVKVPFTHISLLKLSDPVRGDIVIFDSK